MSENAEHRVECFKLVAERRRQGKPSWAEEINLKDVFHNDQLSFIQKRDAIVVAIKKSNWFKKAQADEDNEVLDCVESIEIADDADEFDSAWADLYIHADYARIWIRTV